jgi:hypothetical protein
MRKEASRRRKASRQRLQEGQAGRDRQDVGGAAPSWLTNVRQTPDRFLRLANRFRRPDRQPVTVEHHAEKPAAAIALSK